MVGGSEGMNQGDARGYVMGRQGDEPAESLRNPIVWRGTLREPDVQPVFTAFV